MIMTCCLLWCNDSWYGVLFVVVGTGDDDDWFDGDVVMGCLVWD